MINPHETDIGRKVVYRMKRDDEEEGEITSFNSRYVFVRYGHDGHSKATRREDLHWAA